MENTRRLRLLLPDLLLALQTYADTRTYVAMHRPFTPIKDDRTYPFDPTWNSPVAWSDVQPHGILVTRPRVIGKRQTEGKGGGT
ncbi:hypothetical protein F5Y18DRAFT_400293 [Xylariaceae sp. FL1019]|nr:hypothetical protein F5Y18DRAFT_400293 [Xylariaceae sp. FL1019]